MALESMLHEKISVAEARQWLLNAREEWTGTHTDSLSESELADIDTAIAAMKPVNFKAPRKKRATKTSSSTSERSEADYDESKCDARVWLTGGFAAQCSCKKIDGQFLCKKHQKEADNHCGMVKNGYINAERPTHHYGDETEKAIPWHDVVIEKPKKAEKTKKSSDGSRKPRKCGCCGEIGHDKRSCPMAKGGSSSPMMSVEQAEAALAAAKLAASKKNEETASSVETVSEVVEETVSEVVEETVSEVVEETHNNDELEEDSSVDPGAGVGSHLLQEETAGSDEESSDMIDCTFENIPYSRNSTGQVVDDDGDEVGTWVDGAIKFDRCGEKQHRMAKAAL